MPSTRIILASYGASLAIDNGRWIRNQIEAHPDKLRVRLAPDSKKANQWNTPQGGGVLATSVGGQATGYGADLFVLDDLFKNWQEARSQVQRDHVYNWYLSVARLRLQTDASVLVPMTRWNQDDIIGRLLANDDDGQWEVLNLPALAGDDDPLGRAPGEPLCEAMFTKDDVLQQMADLGPYLSAALLQQSPTTPEGELFLRSKWDFVDEPPIKPTAAVRMWDKAATAGGGDETAGVLVALDADGAYVVDVVHGRWSSAEVEQVVEQTAELDRARWGRSTTVHTVVEQEPGSSGRADADNFVNSVLAGFSAEARPSTGSKEVRAQPAAARQQAGKLFIVKANGTAPAWASALIDQAGDFPHGAHDDIVDAMSSAYAYAAERARTHRKSRGSARSVATRGR